MTTHIKIVATVVAVFLRGRQSTIDAIERACCHESTIDSANLMKKQTLLTTLGLAVLASITPAFAQSAGTEAEQTNRKVDHCSVEQGQRLIDEDRYTDAIREFTCVIDANPTEVEGYRGRMEAELLLGQYAEAFREYARIVAFVLPVDPAAESTMLASYDARLAVAPENVPALTGASFTRWCLFDYPGAVRVINQLLDLRPNDVYGNLFRGSSRVLKGASRAEGVIDLERAIALAPWSPDVRYIVADAYTYGSEPDMERAFIEATRALEWGLDTARVHAILGSAYLKFGNVAAAATHFYRHIELVTTELLTIAPIAARTSLNLALLPGRTYDIPVATAAGETISILTRSHDFWDTICVLLGPDGKPVVGGDDYKQYFAGFKWIAETSGTYRLLVTSFEGVNTGELVVVRE